MFATQEAATVDIRNIPFTILRNALIGERARISAVYALLIVVALLFSCAPVLAADTAAGTVAFVQGRVTIMKEGGKRGAFSDARVGDEVRAGDIIKTGADSKAQITLRDYSVIHVAPNSMMQLKQFVLNRDSGTRNVVVSATEGRLRFVVSKVVKVSSVSGEDNGKDSSFSVQTPTAVAGIQGTDFTVTVSRTHTTVAVFEGIVKVGNVSYLIKGSITLGANEASTVKKDKQPTKPVTLTDAQKNLLKLDTTNLETVKKDAAFAKNDEDADKKDEGGAKKKDEAAAKGVSDDEAAQIEAAIKAIVEALSRDNAEGATPEQMIEAAINAGLNVNETMEVTIDAGVDPGKAVYAAIDAGYEADQVIFSALESGAPLNIVIEAAVQGGASEKDVVEGAKDAGVSDKEIAKEVADNPPGDTAGFTKPDEPVIDIYEPPASTTDYSVPLGGASASTSTSSPSTP